MSMTILEVSKIPYRYIRVIDRHGRPYYADRLIDAHRNRKKIKHCWALKTIWISYREASLKEVITFRNKYKIKIKP